jgi:hypothetical protein
MKVWAYTPLCVVCCETVTHCSVWWILKPTHHVTAAPCCCAPEALAEQWADYWSHKLPSHPVHTLGRLLTPWFSGLCTCFWGCGVCGWVIVQLLHTASGSRGGSHSEQTPLSDIQVLLEKCWEEKRYEVTQMKPDSSVALEGFLTLRIPPLQDKM